MGGHRRVQTYAAVLAATYFWQAPDHSSEALLTARVRLWKDQGGGAAIALLIGSLLRTFCLNQVSDLPPN